MNLNIKFNDGTTQTLVSQTGRLCALYSMKTWEEFGRPYDGSFRQAEVWDAAVGGTAGVTNRLRLGRREIDFLKSMNTAPGLRDWNWAANAPTGLYYQSIDGISIDDEVNWNWVAAPSGRPYDRNVMCFSAFQNGRGQVVAVPKGADYKRCAEIPGMMQRVWGNYRNGTPENNWNCGPLLWNAMMFNPATFPHTKGNGGFWLDQSWLYEKVGEVQVPWINE